MEQGLVYKFLSQKKWDKLQLHLDWISDHLQCGQGMDHQSFASKVGYLLHVVDTYDFARPYLQGLFLSYYAHLNNRDQSGYQCR